MTRLKEILAGLRSCFALAPNERLIIILILALFLFGLALRWRHLAGERPDRYELAPQTINPSKK